MNIAKSITLLLLVVLPQASIAAYRTYENTWFEIEVILFQQLDDKSDLQEVFPDTSKIAMPNDIIDLLGPALHPNIDSLKKRLPQCDNITLQPQNITVLQPLQWNNVNANQFTIDYSPVAYELIPAPIFESYPEDDIAKKALEQQPTISQPFNNVMNNTSREKMNETTSESLEAIEASLPSDISQHELTSINTHSDLNENSLSEAVIASFTQQSRKIAAFQFPKKLCAIPEAYFDEYKTQDPYFSYNKVPTESVPPIITGNEDLSTTQPYLIGEASLQLKDIRQQLKYSRNFKPLLHVGWRQITRLKEEAIPVKLYAGENLMLPYLSALKAYTTAIEEKEALNNIVKQHQSVDTIPQASDVFNHAERIEKNKIENIITEVANNTMSLDSVIEQISTDHSAPKYISSPLTSPLNAQLEHEKQVQLSEPLAPPQHWTLEGLFKVEVERYLHITADFTILDKTEAEQATLQRSTHEPVKLNLMRFEQNKRVRSNEIHYFDHPYMGMIVQIRRHEQVEPEVNETDDTQTLAETTQ